MTSLFDLLTKTDKEIEFVVKFDYRDPDTDAESSIYVSKLGSVPATGSGDTPANEDFPPFILDIGPSTDELSEDLLFSGKGSAIRGSITLDNKPDGQNSGGPLDYLGNLSFSGRAVTVYGGEKGAAFSTFEPIPGSGFTRQEPFFNEDDKTVSFEIQSIITEFSRPFKLSRFVGIPTALHVIATGGSSTATHISAYDLLSYTVTFRFRGSFAGSSERALQRKSTGAGNKNWFVTIFDASHATTPGQVKFTATFGGVDTLIALSSDRYDVGGWHTAVVSVLDKTTAYAMIDNVVIGTISQTTSVDTTGTQVVIMPATVSLNVCEVVFYNTYLTPDEARSVTATRVEGDETGIVADFRMDDGPGATSVTDYSSNGNDVPIAGTENVAWEWVPSDLGMPEHAGLPIPASYGDYFNAPVRYHDTIEERGYWRDDLNTTPSNDVIVKSRGAVLARPGDYSLDVDDIIAFVAEQDEPLTHDSIDNTTNAYPGTILRDLCVDRGGILSSQIEANYLEAITRLIPSEIGVFVDDEKQFGDVILPILSGLGAHARESRNTKLIFHHLLPPVGPGPYNNEAVIEFVGSPTGAVNFGNIANTTGDLSIACWFKTMRGFVSLGSSFLIVPLIFKDSGGGGYYLEVTGVGGLEVMIRNIGYLDSPPGIIKPQTWYFCMATFSNTADTLKLYLGAQGQSLQEVASRSLTGNPATDSTNLTVGGFNGYSSFATIGSVCHAQVWSRAHTLAEAQSLMSTPPIGNEANLLMYSPMNDGNESTTVSEKVLGGVGTISGLTRWAPRLTLNFVTGEGLGLDTRLSGYRQIMPAGRVNVNYDVNYSPMTQADISASVLVDDARKLKLPYSSLPLIRQSIEDDYKQTRTIDLTSPLWRKSAVSYLVNLLATRFDHNSYFAVVNDINRNGVLLELTDEVRIVHPSHSMTSGVHFRVVNRTNDELRTNLNLWTLR